MHFQIKNLSVAALPPHGCVQGLSRQHLRSYCDGLRRFVLRQQQTEQITAGEVMLIIEKELLEGRIGQLNASSAIEDSDSKRTVFVQRIPSNALLLKFPRDPIPLSDPC